MRCGKEGQSVILETQRSTLPLKSYRIAGKEAAVEEAQWERRRPGGSGAHGLNNLQGQHRIITNGLP